ncbi:MAG: hypothetical protein COZ32_07735 [Nitrospirae bacterium CG_4_10_14_3_um_filter_53_41]|nr:MAG: hypothetical protein COW52_12985 [Nitrospirae bacterium CG17_big_fil_post_rev_8_21_14_2_50_50_9]PIX85587.1 MAG: hypothetical protein COZ32_07735 [Nitrospirae bacterium CG_4_10_14_3_um_filter_53_41]
MDQKKNQESNWRHSGFTLVEILVVLAITGLITAGMVNFMISQSQSYSLQEDLQEMEQNARISMDLLTSELKKAKAKDVIPDPLKRGKDDNISIVYEENVGTILKTRDIIYNFVDDVKNTVDDKTSQRIGYMLGPQDSNYNATNQNVGNIGYFITEDLSGNGNPDVPMFQFRYDNKGDLRVVTLTIVSRTKHKDLNYKDGNGNLINRGYRQIVLTRRVVLRN